MTTYSSERKSLRIVSRSVNGLSTCESCADAPVAMMSNTMKTKRLSFWWSCRDARSHAVPTSVRSQPHLYKQPPPVFVLTTNSPSSTVPSGSKSVSGSSPDVVNGAFDRSTSTAVPPATTRKYRTPSVFSDTKYSRVLTSGMCQRAKPTGIVPLNLPRTPSRSWYAFCTSLAPGKSQFVLTA